MALSVSDFLRSGGVMGASGEGPDVASEDEISAILKRRGSTRLEPVVRSIYQQESGSGAADTSGVNYAGVRGPMQVKDTTFAQLQNEGRIPADYRWDDPSHNTEAGIAYIESLAERFGDDPRAIAQGYYGGPGAVGRESRRDPKNAKAPTVGEYGDAVVARMGATGSGNLTAKPRGSKVWENARKGPYQPQQTVAKPGEPDEAKPDEALADTPDMPWTQVVEHDAYKQATPEQREQLRELYWQDVIEPKIPPNQRESARQMFDADTAPGVARQAGDVGKALAGGAVQGTGMTVRGIGEMMREGGDALLELGLRYGLPVGDMEATNPLSGAADAIDKVGEKVLDSRSLKSQIAQQQSTPAGDITDPSTWSFGDDPSLSGYIQHGATVLGQFAPIIASAALTKRLPAGPQMGVMGGLGGAQGGGAAVQQARETIEGMTEEELMQQSSVYAQLRERLGHEQAKAVTAKEAEKWAFRLTVPFSALGGMATGYLLNPAARVGQRLVGASIPGNVALRGVLGGAEEGIQEVSEGVGTQAGINQGAGMELGLFDESLPNAVLGALGGTGPGAVAGGLAARAERARRAADAVRRGEPIPPPEAGPATPPPSGPQGPIPAEEVLGPILDGGPEAPPPAAGPEPAPEVPPVAPMNPYEGQAFRYTPGFEGGAPSGATAFDVIETERERGAEIVLPPDVEEAMKAMPADRLMWVGRSPDQLMTAYGPQTGPDGQVIYEGMLQSPDELTDVSGDVQGAQVVYEDPSDGALLLLPESAPAAPSSTGLVEMGQGMAAGMSESLRRQLWEAYRQGDTKMAGIEDPALKAARQAKVPRDDREAFDRFLTLYGEGKVPSTPAEGAATAAAPDGASDTTVVELPRQDATERDPTRPDATRDDPMASLAQSFTRWNEADGSPIDVLETALNLADDGLLPPELEDAARAFQAAVEDDFGMAGRGDTEDAEQAFLDAVEQALNQAPAAKQTAPESASVAQDAKDQPPSSTPTISRRGKYRDGAPWKATYGVVQRTDGRYAVTRTLEDDEGAQTGYLTEDGEWKLGEPPTAAIQMNTGRIAGGPEVFPTPEAAFEHIRSTEDGEDAGDEPPPPPAGPAYGEGNKVFTKSKADEARERLKARMAKQKGETLPPDGENPPTDSAESTPLLQGVQRVPGAKVVGANADGEIVYEDADGIRWVQSPDNPDIRIGQKVRMVPTRAGMKKEPVAEPRFEVVPRGGMPPSRGKPETKAERDARLAEEAGMMEWANRADEEAEEAPAPEPEKPTGPLPLHMMMLNVLPEDQDAAVEAFKRKDRAALEAMYAKAHPPKLEEKANEAATSPTNDLPEPTEAQKEAGNYKKGHVRIQGLDISIENPKGSTRSGKDRGGNEWSVKMPGHYGYIKGTVGRDKDHIDVTLGEDPEDETRPIFVFNQATPDEGVFDEHKVFMGYEDEEDATDAYRSSFNGSFGVRMVKNLRGVARFTPEQFKDWLKNGDHKKPAKTPPLTLDPKLAAMSFEERKAARKKLIDGYHAADREARDLDAYGQVFRPMWEEAAKLFPDPEAPKSNDKKARKAWQDAMSEAMEMRRAWFDAPEQEKRRNEHPIAQASEAASKRSDAFERQLPYQVTDDEVAYSLEYNKGRSKARVTVAQFSDGLWATGSDVSLPTSGHASGPNKWDTDVYATREEAIAAGISQLRRHLMGVAGRSDSMAGSDKKTAAAMLKRLNKEHPITEAEQAELEVVEAQQQVEAMKRAHRAKRRDQKNEAENRVLEQIARQAVEIVRSQGGEMIARDLAAALKRNFPRREDLVWDAIDRAEWDRKLDADASDGAWDETKYSLPDTTKPKKSLEEAFEENNQALFGNPDKATSYLKDAMLGRMMWPNDANEQKKLDDAEKEIRKRLGDEAWPGLRDAGYAAALRAYREGLDADPAWSPEWAPAKPNFAEYAFQAIAVACPRCGAKPGRPCKRPSGHETKELHAERKALADDLFVKLWGEKAVIDYDTDKDRWGVRTKKGGEFVTWATKGGRNADQATKTAASDLEAEEIRVKDQLYQLDRLADKAAQDEFRKLTNRSPHESSRKATRDAMARLKDKYKERQKGQRAKIQRTLEDIARRKAKAAKATAPEHQRNKGKPLDEGTVYEPTGDLEHTTYSAELGEVEDLTIPVEDFKEATDEWAELFADPEEYVSLEKLENKGDIKRLNREQADAQLAKWKKHAKDQGKTGVNNGRTILSLFDYTGEWAKPWAEAGYDVVQLDIQHGTDIFDLSVEWFVNNDVTDVYGVLAACPCTDFASSGARHFAEKDADGRTEASKELVFQTLRSIEYLRPAFWALENPVGRIERLTGLPKARMSFDPYHFGADYAKKTMLWGKFNADLPTAMVEPTEGSKMHRMYGGKSQKTKNARSETPEGFAYAFFMANNWADKTAEQKLIEEYPEASGAIRKAIEAGITEQEIRDVMYRTYENLEPENARAELAKMVQERGAKAEEESPEVRQLSELLSLAKTDGQRYYQLESALNRFWAGKRKRFPHGPWKDMRKAIGRKQSDELDLVLRKVFPDIKGKGRPAFWNQLRKRLAADLELATRAAEETLDTTREGMSAHRDAKAALEKVQADDASGLRDLVKGINTLWTQANVEATDQRAVKTGAMEPADPNLFEDRAAWNTRNEARRELEKAWGQSNKVFTKEKAEAARARLLKKRSQLNAGLDPDMVRDGLTLAGYHIEAGVRSFRDFVRKMVADLGEEFLPYLKSWYMAAMADPEVEAIIGDDQTDDPRKLKVEDVRALLDDGQADEALLTEAPKDSDLFRSPEEAALRDQMRAFREKWDAMDYGQRQAIAERAYPGMRKVVHRISGSKWAELSPGEAESVTKAAQQPAPAPEPAAEPKQRELIEHTTRRGKKLTGTIVKGLTDAQAKSIDEYTWRMKGGHFIRQEHFAKLDEFEARQPAKAAPAPAPVEAPKTGALDPKDRAFVDAVKARLWGGPDGGSVTPIATLRDARALYAQMTKSDPDGPAIKRVDELIELAVVEKARWIIGQGGTPASIFQSLVQLYNSQPRLTTRTSTSVEQQAYSTPAPLAYIASQLARITKKTQVYEPTAGNGMLLIATDPNLATVNELNDGRATNLRDQGFQVTQKDASVWAPHTAKHVVIANPPFGVLRDSNGNSTEFRVEPKNTQAFITTEIDHAIAFKALTSMMPDGRAVLILGGLNKQLRGKEARSDGYNAAAKRKFYYHLYNNFNVTDHFTVAGELYERQGAGWPVDVILIEGLGKSSRALPAVDVPRVYDSWEALTGLVERANERAAEDQADRMGAGPQQGGPATGVNSGGERPAGDVGQPDGLDRPAGAVDGGQGAGPATGGEPATEGTGGSGTLAGGRPGAAGRSGRDPGGVKPGAQDATGAARRKPAGSAGPGEATDPGMGNAGSTLDLDGGSPVAGGRAPELAASDNVPAVASEGQTPYAPRSKVYSLSTLVPVNMKTAIEESLDALIKEVGPLDNYVAEKLGYDAGRLSNYFGAEQVDALALAISQVERGSGFVIGDQTGIGKGRVVAAMIRYAIKKQMTPVFVTEKPNLYGDMMRDLEDIGVKGIKPLMTNSNEKVPYGPDGELELKPVPKQKLQDLADEATLGEFDVLFTTYSQMQGVAGNFATPRHLLLRAVAPNALLIFDESHNAGGQTLTRGAKGAKAGEKTGRAGFARSLIGQARGVFYSSATYAKRPEVMDLYSKTDMVLAVESPDKLPAAIEAGGVPLQQVVASMLAKSGQYIRRERTFDGVEYNATPVPVDRDAAEAMASVMSAVAAFDEVKRVGLKKIKQDLKAEAGALGIDTATGQTGATSTNFTSLMHNVIDQMLLTLKVDAAAEKAIEALKRDEKPVITVAFTMGAFIEDYVESAGLHSGDAIDVDFRSIMLRYLDRSRDVTIKDANGGISRRRMTDEELGPMGVAAYQKAHNLITNSEGIENIPLSPIDRLHYLLQKAGYKTGEITGRSHTIEYGDNGEATFRLRPNSERNTAGKIATISAFNSGEMDVVILNQSGATGLSLHASEKFKDQRRRRMIIAQAERNIDTHMQMLGRVHRTGQVIPPAYDQLVADIPAEKRPAAVLAKKMASLNANTTAARTSVFTAKDVPDFMNEYGDKVVAALMTDMPEIHEALLEPLNDAEEGLEVEGAARKVTGRIPLLPIEQQEQVYESIEQAYAELIEQENALGTNKLEAKTLPLEAKTASKDTIFDGDEGSSSPFAGPAYMEKVSVKKIGKAYTQDQVRQIAAGKNGLGKDATWEQIKQAGARRQQSMASDVHQRYTQYKEQLLAEMLSRGVDEKALQARETALDAVKNRVSELLQFKLKIGETYKIGMGDDLAVYGVLADITQKKGGRNPSAPGSWVAHFLIADGAKSLNITAATLLSDAGLRAERMGWDEDGTRVLDLFDQVQTVSREDRFVATGNLLAAFGQLSDKHGQVVNFTDDAGRVRQGVLMPKKYKFDKDRFENEKPVYLTEDSAVSFLDALARDWRYRRNKQAGIESVKGPPVKIVRRGYNNTEIVVPKAKSRGGEVFLDDGLRAIVGDFVARGNNMVASVGPDRLGRALGYIGRKWGPLVARVGGELAEEAGGTKNPRQVMYSRKGGAGWYSPTLRVVESAKQARMSAEQWEGWIRNQAGVKPEELDYLNLAAWLRQQEGKTIPREKVAEYIRAHQLEVREVVKGPPEGAQSEELQKEQAKLVEQFAKAGFELDGNPEDGPLLIFQGGALDGEIAIGGGFETDETVPESIIKAFERYVEIDNMAGITYGAQTPEEAYKAPKYAKWKPEGGENYREILFTLPADVSPREALGGEPRVLSAEEAGKELGMEWDDFGPEGTKVLIYPTGVYLSQLPDETYHVQAFNEDDFFDSLPAAEAWLLNRMDGEIDAKGTLYQSPHWTESNVVAHMRLEERVDADGKRTLVVIENQSDQHQAGRKKGYFAKGTPTKDRPRYSVPEAPFKTTWPELVMKRAIRWAAENGFDRVAWLPGDVQVDLYNLERSVRRINWARDGENDRIVTILPIAGNDIEFRVKPDGSVAAVGMGRLGNELDGADIQSVVGKELGDRILAEKYGEVDGDGLVIGGKGMREFYDNILRKTVDRLIKKFGGKVSTTKLASEGTTWNVRTPDGGLRSFEARWKAEKYAEEIGAKAIPVRAMDVWTFDVTPKLREFAQAGMPLFRDRQQAPAAGATPAQVYDWLKSQPRIGRLNVVRDVAELRRAVGDPNIADDTEGVYVTGEDEAYIVASNIPDQATAERVYRHEVMGHLAVEIYGDIGAAVGDVLSSRNNPDIARLWHEVATKQPGLDRKAHAKEVIALVAERGMSSPFIARLIGRVRTLIRKLGIALQFGEADIRAIIAQAARAATKKGARYGTSIREALASRGSGILSQVAGVLDGGLYDVVTRAGKLIEGGFATEEAAKAFQRNEVGVRSRIVKRRPTRQQAEAVDFWIRDAGSIDQAITDLQAEVERGNVELEPVLSGVLARKRHPKGMAQYSRRGDSPLAFVAEVIRELGAVDALFKNPSRRITSLVQAFEGIPNYSVLENATEEEDTRRNRVRWVTHYQRHGKDGRFTERVPVYVYTSGDKVWIDVSELEPGEGGDRIYQAIADYARTTNRRFVGDPDGLSPHAVARRTYHMLSNMIRHGGDLGGFQPAANQLEGDRRFGIPKLRWPDDAEGQMRSLIKVFYGTLRHAYPAITGIRYDFESGTFRNGAGRVLSDDDFVRMARAPTDGIPQGSRALRAGILLQSLARLESEGRPGLLGQVLRQPSAVVRGTGVLFSRRGPEGATDRGRARGAGELDHTGLIDAAFKHLGGKQFSKLISSPLYDRVIQAGGSLLPEKLKHGLISDYGLPEPYLDAKIDKQAGVNRVLRKTRNLVEMLAGLDREQSRIAYLWMNEKPDTDLEAHLLARLPEDSRAVVQRMKEMVDELGRQAVEVGLLTQESYERNAMAYLHRSYKAHMTAKGESVHARHKKNATIRADNYKGRGLRDNVDPATLGEFELGDMRLRIEKRGPRGGLQEVAYIPTDAPIPEGWVADGEWEIRWQEQRPGMGEVVGMWRDLTPEERQRLGEVEEVRYAFAKTMLNAIHDIENQKFLAWVGEEYGVDPDDIDPDNIVEASEGFISLKTYSADQYVRVPKTSIPRTPGLKKYGKLAGQVIPAVMWNDIRATMALPESDIARFYERVMRAWKISKTALSPTVHTNNVMANFVLADIAEVRGRDIVKALHTIVKAKSGDEAAAELIARYEDSGAESGSFHAMEIQQDIIKPLLEELENQEDDSLLGDLSAVQIVSLLKAGDFKNAGKALGQKPGLKQTIGAGKRMIDIYRSEDSVFRLAKFMRELEAGRSDRDAGKAARDAFLNYEINAPLIQAARRSVLPFVAFSYRAIPKMIETAAKKPWKVAKYFMIGYVLNSLSYAMLGLGADDEDKERALLPEELQGRVLGVVPRLIRMPWNDKNDAPTFLDVRRWVPAGDIMDTMGSHSVVPLPNWLSVGGPIAFALEAYANKSMFTGEPIVKETDTAGQKAAKFADYAFKWAAPNLPLPNPLNFVLPAGRDGNQPRFLDLGITPGIDRDQMQTYAWSGVLRAGTGREDAFGRESGSVRQALASSFGFKARSYPTDVGRYRTMGELGRFNAEIDANLRQLAKERARGGLTDEEYRERVAVEVEKKRDHTREAAEKLGAGAQ